MSTTGRYRGWGWVRKPHSEVFHSSNNRPFYFILDESGCDVTGNHFETLPELHEFIDECIMEAGMTEGEVS